MSSVKFIPIILFLITLKRIGAVNYRVIYHADKNPNSSKLKNEIRYSSAERGFTDANEFVRRTFNLKADDVERYDDVTLTIESFREYGLGRHPGSVASTVRNKVCINRDYLESFHGDRYKEFMGIVFHETTHVWQWDGNGMAPKGLINGIADFVRLTAGWPSAAWTQRRGSGSRWDEGYAVTAYFLEYCNRLKSGFIAELNAMMKHHYTDDYFRQLLGRNVHELWEDYKVAYEVKTRAQVDPKNRHNGQEVVLLGRFPRSRLSSLESKQPLERENIQDQADLPMPKSEEKMEIVDTALNMEKQDITKTIAGTFILTFDKGPRKIGKLLVNLSGEHKDT